eukprot:6891268-Ditylum_brightwellii.AAC.1
MKTRAEIGRSQSSIQSTNVTNSKYLVSDDNTVETYLSTDDSEEENDSKEDDVGYNPNEANVLLDEIYMKSLSGEINRCWQTQRYQPNILVQGLEDQS